MLAQPQAAFLRGALACETVHSASLFLATVQTAAASARARATVFPDIKAKELVFTSGTLLEYSSEITAEAPRRNTYASAARSLSEQENPSVVDVIFNVITRH